MHDFEVTYAYVSANKVRTLPVDKEGGCRERAEERIEMKECEEQKKMAEKMVRNKDRLTREEEEVKITRETREGEGKRVLSNQVCCSYLVGYPHAVSADSKFGQ